MVDEAVRALSEGLGDQVAVVALGGYGRGELQPGSDVDLMVLHAERKPERVRAAAERVFYPLWDAGLELGHAVRTAGESLSIAEERLDALTALLDARVVAGDPTLAEEVRERLLESVRSASDRLLRGLAADRAARADRFGSCAADLEPDLKESAGGLRDLVAIGWLERALPGAALLRARERADLDDAHEFLVRLRSALHLESGTRTDRVRMERQPQLARDFGFEATAGLDAPDALMRTLFTHARHVEHGSTAALERAHATLADGPAPPVPRAASGAEALEAFAEAAESGGVLAAEPLDALEAAFPEPFVWDERSRAALVRILAAGDRGRRTLDAMDRAGLLTRILPGWAEVRCRPQRDPYHRWSVDVHLLRTCAAAAAILGGDHDDDPVLAAAAAAVTDREAMLLGALLHDVGKRGEGRHVPVGVAVAGTVLDRLGIGGPAREDVLFLVAEHLLLPDTATRRDLSDENLVLDVAAKVATPERLAMLYVLAVADAAATGPHAASAWRRALVRDLVGKVQRVLERGEPDRLALLGRRLEEAAEALALAEPAPGPRTPAELGAYLDRLPRTYLLAVDADAVARHRRLVAPPLGANEARTEVRPGGRSGTYELAVVVADRPGLLATLSGALALSGLNILSAQAFTTEDGVAIDLFTVEGTFEREVDEARWRAFRTTLRQALEGRISLAERVREKRRHYPAPAEIPVEIAVDEEASDFYTVIEVGAADRIGLLFDLSTALHALDVDVHLAKVSTYGSRVIDAFYVRDLEGRKLPDALQARAREAIEAALG